MEETKLLICDCNCSAHQMIIFTCEDEVEKIAYVHIHLNKRPFLQRLVYAFKYLFGYKSSFGAFDEFILSEKHVKDLKAVTNHLQNVAK